MSDATAVRVDEQHISADRVSYIVMHDGPIEVGSKVQIYEVPPTKPNEIDSLRFRVPDHVHSA